MPGRRGVWRGWKNPMKTRQTTWKMVVFHEKKDFKITLNKCLVLVVKWNVPLMSVFFVLKSLILH